KQDNIRLHEELAARLDEINEKNRQLEEAVGQLETMAATDPLTGLLNRRAFQQTVERSFAEARRHAHDAACVMIDLDG
ncbi:GGDEF domain-containing protein, partial [Tritonibacter sp. SIMBA_163]|uniref:GGDEF domain-containing protein n=1 Tax=Tritonibacter sp. SIMBA_163 TaxID=3080868 RepID=UPI00397EA9C9